MTFLPFGAWTLEVAAQLTPAALQELAPRAVRLSDADVVVLCRAALGP